MIKYYFYSLKKIIKPKRALFIFNHSELSKKKKYSLLIKSGVRINDRALIVPPFHYEHGNIELLGNVFVNANCIFLDREKITIKDGAMIGPNVSLVTISHNSDIKKRHTHDIIAPIVIEQNAWVCAGAVILPGVTIGENSIVAANSVVNCDVPANTMYAGTPAVFKKHLN